MFLAVWFVNVAPGYVSKQFATEHNVKIGQIWQCIREFHGKLYVSCFHGKCKMKQHKNSIKKNFVDGSEPTTYHPRVIHV
jgi:hypothetical protein